MSPIRETPKIILIFFVATRSKLTLNSRVCLHERDGVGTASVRVTWGTGHTSEPAAVEVVGGYLGETYLYEFYSGGMYTADIILV